MRTLIQATLTAGNRMLCVDSNSISVFPADNTLRSNAAWILTDHATYEWCRRYRMLKDRITYATEWPSELTALVHGVLGAESPLQPMMDWVIEHGPANLASEIETLQKHLLAGCQAITNPEPTPVPF